MPEDTFGDRLKKLVKMKGISNVTFSNIIGISSPNVYKYFNNKVTPTITLLQIISKEWPDASIRWLLLGEGEALTGENQSQEEDLSEKVKSLENIIEDKELIIQLLKDKLENQKI